MEASRRSPFGIALRHFREAGGFSQEQLAERAGLSVRGISDLERGVRTTPRLETVRLLADGLGLNETERRQLLDSRIHGQDSTTFRVTQGMPVLPVPVTSFIGREDEIAAVERMLQIDQLRLVTLLGPGGIGKTRLAIEVAHRLADGFIGGAIFVDLSAIKIRDLVLPAIACRLGIPDHSGRDVKETLLIALQDRHLLLILDNLEQVVDAATDIAWLHASFPDLALIVTSRVRLRITAENVMPIESLTLPADGDDLSLHEVDAVALFMDRANAIDPEFTLGDGNSAEVAEIVARLQGMPLAIELAAARIGMLSVRDLLKRLESQLPVLTGGARDSPRRHRTMRDTIAWSYELLPATVQAVFRTLAIFPDGCTLDSAVKVFEVDRRFSESETLEAIEVLIDSSMVRRREGSDGEVRFRMLQTVREFGLEQLAEAREEDTARMAAHFAWAVPLARRSEFLMSEPEEIFWLNRVAAEHPNLREHLAWLEGNDYIEGALNISGSLANFRILRWDMEEGRQELERLLANPRAQGFSIARMTGYIGLGIISNHNADFARGLEVSREGLILARQFGEPRHLALALYMLSISLFYSGRLDEAEKLYAEQEAVSVSSGDTFFIACTLYGRAAIADHRGDLEKSGRLLEEALKICQSAGHVWGMALCLHNLGYQCIRTGELDQAELLVLEGQELFAEIEGRGGSPSLYLTLADIAWLNNDHIRSALMLDRALALSCDNGSTLHIVYSLLGLARITAYAGDPDAAREHTLNAIQWYGRSGSAIEVVICLDLLTDIALATHDPSRAAWCIGAVESVHKRQGIHRTEREQDEHQLRVEGVIAQLGEVEWRIHFDRGHATTNEAILAELRSW